MMPVLGVRATAPSHAPRARPGSTCDRATDIVYAFSTTAAVKVCQELMCDVGVLRLLAQPVNNFDAWLQSYAFNNSVMQHCACAGWTKLGHMYCSDRTESTYGSLHAAQKACLQTSSSCGGVYDDRCDGSGTFSLCRSQNPQLQQSSQNSCVYKVSRATLKKCTCKNGTPAVGDRSAHMCLSFTQRESLH